LINNSSLSSEVLLISVINSFSIFNEPSHQTEEIKLSETDRNDWIYTQIYKKGIDNLHICSLHDSHKLSLIKQIKGQ
jgi:hypothetical protein